jgi:chromosome partitioning protein
LLHARNFREHIVAKSLASVRDRFEFVIIDCQPSLDVLPINALVAADKLLVPCELSGNALRGLADLLKTIEFFKDASFEFRILITNVSGFAAARQEQAWRILDPIKDRILHTQIRRTEAIERSRPSISGLSSSSGSGAAEAGIIGLP